MLFPIGVAISNSDFCCTCILELDHYVVPLKGSKINDTSESKRTPNTQISLSNTISNKKTMVPWKND